jgi:anti-sigma factor (TIGR02949 family)
MINNKKIKQISCDEALERMFEYIDGVLAGKPHSELEHHIETCRGCLKKLDFQLKLKKRLTRVKQTPVSRKLSARLNKILESQ